MNARVSTTHRLLAIAAVALLGVAACSSGESTFDSTMLDEQLDSIPLATLADSEVAGLLWMREEEKLAHDVYATLGEQWGLQIFDNIASSESTHTAAVKTLLDRYGLDDPSAGTALGEFTDPAIQSLYDTFVEQGNESLVAALTVGATIEDLDIADLQTLTTETADIALVYANLAKGSRNHLRAFTRQLASNGAAYTPSYITQEQYDEIIADDIERGPGG